MAATRFPVPDHVRESMPGAEDGESLLYMSEDQIPLLYQTQIDLLPGNAWRQKSETRDAQSITECRIHEKKY
jgi:hypothetical protein